MIRSIIFFLMFMFVYFLGMQTGNLEVKNKSARESDKTEEVAETEEKQEVVYLYEEEIEKVDLKSRGDEHYTKKAAGFLESIVTGIFNFVLSLLYKVVNIFY